MRKFSEKIRREEGKSLHKERIREIINICISILISILISIYINLYISKGETSWSEAPRGNFINIR